MRKRNKVVVRWIEEVERRNEMIIITTERGHGH
jgi:hypothetical protein